MAAVLVEDETWNDQASQARAMTHARSAKAFVAARRHSRWVRFLRVALLVGSCGAIVVVVALTLYRTFGPRLVGLSLGDLSINGTKITMDHPRLTGARSDGAAYVITALTAIQDIAHPTQVELQDIDGDIGSRDAAPMKLSANAGHYDTEKETLDLKGVVRLRNSSYTVELKSAHIDFKSGVYDTREPITVVTNSGASIVADSAVAKDNASQLTFEGHVKTLIAPRDNANETASEMKSNEP